MTENNHKRIVITGASGVGKTTLVEKLTPLLHLPGIPEVARQLCDELGVKYPGEIPDQEGFKNSVLTKQIEAEELAESFIADRSTIDCWVLWQRWQMATAMSFDSEAYYDRAKAQAEKYTHIIYVPPMFTPPDDGFRWNDKDYQTQIDRLIRFTIFDWQLSSRTFTIESSDVESRVSSIQAWLLEH